MSIEAIAALLGPRSLGHASPLRPIAERTVAEAHFDAADKVDDLYATRPATRLPVRRWVARRERLPAPLVDDLVPAARLQICERRRCRQPRRVGPGGNREEAETLAKRGEADTLGYLEHGSGRCQRTGLLARALATWLDRGRVKRYASPWKGDWSPRAPACDGYRGIRACG